jgi:hypothetical protein
MGTSRRVATAVSTGMTCVSSAGRFAFAGWPIHQYQPPAADAPKTIKGIRKRYFMARGSATEESATGSAGYASTVLDGRQSSSFTLEKDGAWA